MTLVWTTMHEDLFRTAGTSATRSGERMERIFRDVAMDWGHFGNVIRDWAWRELARERLGLAPGSRAQAGSGAPVTFDELSDRARADLIAAWESSALVAGSRDPEAGPQASVANVPGSPDRGIDPVASVAFAVVLAGAAARAVDLCCRGSRGPGLPAALRRG